MGLFQFPQRKYLNFRLLTWGRLFFYNCNKKPLDGGADLGYSAAAAVEPGIFNKYMLQDTVYCTVFDFFLTFIGNCLIFVVGNFNYNHNNGDNDDGNGDDNDSYNKK